jgi:hypothetical protein
MTEALRTRSWPAWTLAIVGALTLLPASVWGLGHTQSTLSWSAQASQTAGLVAIGCVGLVLTLRRPDNSIGWIFACVWAYSGVYTALTAYGQSLVLRGSGVAEGDIVTWLVNWAWVPIIAVLAFFPPLLFPTGRTLGARWRPLVPAGAVLIALWSLAFAFQPSQYTDAYGTDLSTGNPFASPWLPEVIDTLPFAFAMVFVGFVGAAITSLFLRFRRGDAVIRAQLKWFVLGVLCWVPVLLYPGDHGSGGVIDVLVAVALAGPPVAMAVAILRYRLYDIDRIISRTTSYGIVTAAVVLTYALVVTTVTTLVPASNTLAVAGATLAAAAIARPLLRRVQEAVDRRFNRARYDAQVTVEAFGTALRTETDTDTVLADLDEAIRQTLEPQRVKVWLR